MRRPSPHESNALPAGRRRGAAGSCARAPSSPRARESRQIRHWTPSVPAPLEICERRERAEVLVLRLERVERLEAAHLALLEVEDLVAVLDGRQPVRDAEEGLLGLEAQQEVGQRTLGDRVEG